MQSSANASKWVFWAQESGHLFLLQKVSCEVSCLTPLYILQVTLAGPRTTVEAQAFYRMYHSYADIPDPWDRLRWCRYGLDLLQKEVAAMVGMEEWLYRDLESGAFHRSLRTSSPPFTASQWRIFWTTTPCFCTGAEEPSSADTGRQRLEPSAACRPRKGQPDKHPLLGKRAKDHQSEVLLPSGGKPWFRFSIYASHVRYGNFSPVKRKARLQATICGSADGLSLWNHSVSIILIFALTYMAFRKTRSRSSNVAFHAGCSENTVCST